MLDCNELACSRNDRILFSDLTFRLGAGAALQVQAANGAGKTTLLKTIAGLLTPERGQVRCTGKLIYLGHKTNFHPALSPSENLRFMSSLNQTNKALDQQLQASLNFAGLHAVANMSCAELSAGQVQRINLALLYLSDAELWILDEPSINFDQSARSILISIYQQHLTKGGAALIATHLDLYPQAEILRLEQYA